MRGKGESEKTVELLTDLNGAAFAFFFRRFTTKGMITGPGKDFGHVKKPFVEHFIHQEELRNVIRKASDAILDKGDLLWSLDRLEAVYTQAAFNAGAKFGFSRVAVTKLPACYICNILKSSRLCSVKSRCQGF